LAGLLEHEKLIDNDKDSTPIIPISEENTHSVTPSDVDGNITIIKLRRISNTGIMNASNVFLKCLIPFWND
jgi:hypothetical protein